jgi:hypothetical protein
VTGNPIYLVSACATGEEFVAAFRRYADKTGLFVPIGDPFVPGRRARMAVTLVDGGVMIEGEAEVVAAARTPSILHGRVGMTLRFLEPDAASRTLLVELEKARLAMKPAPPSVSPRPATLPAAPRPVPPPPQGRIDAINALAECVAIGNAEALAGLVLAAATVPPRAGPRFVVPTVPTLRPRAPTPLAVPVISATLRRDSAEGPAAGPSSDTLVAVAPPSASPSTLRGAIVAPISAVTPTSVTTPPTAPAPRAPTPLPFPAVAPRAPTPLPFPAVAPPRHAVEMAVAVPRTSTKQSAAAPPPTQASAADALAESAAYRTSSDVAIVIATLPRDDVSARTQVHAGAPPPPAVAPVAPPVDIDVDVDIDIEVAEPTDLVELVSEPTVQPAAESADVTESRPRKTALGVAVAVAPDDAPDDAPGDPAVVAAEETTGRDRGELVDPLLDGMTPTDMARPLITPPSSRYSVSPPGAAHLLEDRTPIDLPVRDWGIPQVTPIETAEVEPSPPAAVPPGPASRSLVAAFTRITPPATSATAPALPSGDWTIAIDPAAPDGWTAPLPTVKPQPAESVAGPPPTPRARPPSAAEPARSEPLPAEPKVQIDPTLIEPLHPGLFDDRAPLAAAPPTSSAASYAVGSAALPSQSHPGLTGPLPSESFPPPYRSPLPTGDAPVYAHPGYPMMPMGNPSSPADVADGSFGVPGHSATMLRNYGSRKNILIVVASAALAVAIGIAAVVIAFRRSEAEAPSPPPRTRSSMIAPAPPAAPSPAPPAAPSDHAADPPPATATAPATTSGRCFADVSSVPSGAEIVVDDHTVVGTTPQTVALPCGAPIDLMIRKARLVPVTRSITPTAGGVKVRVALTKQTAQIKISSSPEGATVTLNGRALGITPTTVKVPALETSTLTITKNGYEPLTEKVSPKPSGATVRVQLHRPER